MVNMFRNGRIKMSTEAEKRASLKYERENVRQISVKLNKKTDADILEALDQIRTSGGSIQGFIKRAIRASL